MKPLKLTLKNFGPYLDEEIDFTRFEASPLFLINGKTGSGKTTIFDAMTYALYGTTSAAGKTGRDAKEMRSKFADAKAQTKVSLTFSHQGKVYQVERSMKEKKTATTLDSKVELSLIEPKPVKLLAAKTREVERQVTALIGLDAKQFSQVIVLPQGEFDNFLKADANQKEALLERFFDTAIYKRLEEKLLAQSKELETQLESSNQLINNQLAAYPEYEVKTAPEWLAKVTETLAALEESGQQKASMITGLEDRQTKLNQQLGFQEQLHAQLEAKETLVKRQTELAATRAEFEANKTRLDQLTWAKEQLSNWQLFQQNQRELVALKERQQKEELTQGDLQAQLAALDQQAPAVAKNTADLQALRQKVSYLKEIEPHYEAYVNKQTQQLALKQNLTSKQAHYADLQADLKAAQTAEQALRQQISSLPNLKQLQEEFYRTDRQLANLTQERTSLTKLYQAYLDAQAKLTRTKEALADKKAKLAVAKEKFTALDQEYTSLQIVRLTQKLQPGQPCPVCGALDHPLVNQGQVADLAKVKQVESDLEQAQTDLTSLQSDYNQLEGRLKVQKQTHLAAQADYQAELKRVLANHSLQAGGELKQLANQFQVQKQHLESNLKEASAREEDLKAKQADSQQKIDQLNLKLEKAQVAVTQAQQDFQTVNDELISLKAKLAPDYQTKDQVLSERQELELRCAQLEQELANFERNKNQVKEALLTTKTNLSNLEENLVKVQTKVANYQTNLKAAIAQVDFVANFDDLSYLLSHVAESTALKAQVTGYQDEVKLVTEQLAAIEQQLAGVTVLDLEELRGKLVAVKQDLQVRRTALEEVTRKKERLHDSYVQVKREVGKNETLLAKLDRLNQLTAPISGKGVGKIDLQRFVLQQYFQKILGNANVILQTLSQDRYLFQMTTTQAKSGTKAGLVLDVVDKISGERRRTQTLSGGESFVASLSLALGLAETIQAENGGVRIEALFIDEGFGSLDTDYLARALDYLQTKEGDSRMVGIISHVRELQESIPDRLEINNRNGKSTVSYHL
ncbi:SMC family ATPase [Ligilactobacillus agilis]|uniref:AAA family ATPase n=1 Tax=Ligilactobacillus agilis TaxID=1601 RepID=UPI00067EC630|nr:SMC family ATPase [Ligilactobacillus agilis]UNL43447.1 SMC family ATPase [Ligilactobacillus agilis]UNL57600.1 SMC family ATPase [Ligilactobacillus agilis]